MQEIKNRFENMQSEYLALLEKIKNIKGYTAYCDTDFFTLEPFYAELYNIDTGQMRLVDDPEKLEGSQTFQLYISDDKVLFHREWLGENCYYDGLFDYQDNTKTRLVVYVKGNEIKPICLEILERDEDGSFKRFYCINQYGSRESHYNYNQFTLLIDYFTHNENYVREKTLSYQVHISTEDYSVSSIDRIDGAKSQVVYDASLKNFPLKKLLEQALKSKTNDILRACKNDGLMDKKAHCLLIEYSPQSPLHCSLALIQEHETKSEKNEHPLIWLSAPDAELFMDEVASDHDSLYEHINQLFDTMQDREYAEKQGNDVSDADTNKHSQQLIKDFYIQLCKSLKLKICQDTALQLTDDFYVCARDFEACNEEEYLQSILPEKQLKKINKAIETYENKQKKRSANDPVRLKVIEMKQLAEAIVPELIQAAEKMPANYWYSDEHLYFIEPFRFEQNNSHKTDRWQDLLSRKIPSSSFYFRYQMNGDLPISIAQISEGKTVRQWYWKKENNRTFEIEYYCFKDTPHVESCSLLELTDGKASSYTAYGLILDQQTYTLDDSGKIVQAHWLSAFPGHPESDTTGIDVFYEYQNEKIAKIYRKPGKWDTDERFCIYFPRQTFK